MRGIPGGARRRGLLVAGLLAGLCACATAPPLEEVPSAERYYRLGMESLEGSRSLLFFRDVDYARAVELFQEVIDNYPYSDYATLAELKIADVHFDQRRFEEAASYYHDFVELHPNHPQVPYALYRNGLCSFERMREPDRDQAPTHDAIAHFRVLLERHPDSEYVADAGARLAEAEDRLARHDVSVGDFYFERGDYHAAARRYRGVLGAFPNHSDATRTKIRLASSLREINQADEAILLLQQILADGVDGDLAEQARDQLEALGLSPTP
jgi:outer membrane protein assembly factor BamD